MGTLNHPAKITKFYLLKISAPIFLSNLAIPLVGIVDTGLMGNLSNEKFLVATSIATSVITMIFWSFGFLRMGTTGLVAQALGRGDYKDIYLTTLRNLIMAIKYKLGESGFVFRIDTDSSIDCMGVAKTQTQVYALPYFILINRLKGLLCSL